jgi:hypothetical protein
VYNLSPLSSLKAHEEEQNLMMMRGWMEITPFIQGEEAGGGEIVGPAAHAR